MTHINLYDDEDFLITASDDHFDKVVIFLNPAAGLELKGVNTVQKNKLPPVKMLAGLYTSAGISEINFWSKNAHWYQRPALDACIAVLRKAIGGREQQTVIYGSSMGGFGALHVGSELNITVAAFSPQVTLDESFNIHPEWQIPLDYARHHFGSFKSNIIEGKYSKSPIYIFYDGKHPLDEKHASYLRRHCRQATFFNIPYSGHACTGTINQHYGLKRLIIEILDGTFSPSVFRKELFSSFTIAEKKPFTSKEYFFYLQDIIREPANRLLFLGPQEYQYKKLCLRLLDIIYNINKKDIHNIISSMCDHRAILQHAVKFLPKSNHALARILDNEFTRIEACADFYFNKKLYNKAAFLYQKLYDVQSDNIYLACQLAYSLHRAGHVQHARETLQHYLEKKGEHPDILSCLGELTLADGEFSRARKYLAASLRLQKNVPACLHYAQSLKREKGSPEESILFLEKYQNQFSDSGVFLAWLGRFQIEVGKMTDGQATLTKASSLPSCPAWAAELLQKNSSHQAKQDLCTSCAQLWRKVKTACHHVSKNIPTPANSLILQAEGAMRQQQYLEALQLWTDIQKKFPRHPRGYTGAAEASMELKDFAQAEAFCLQGQKSAPNAAGPLVFYAACAMRQQRYSEALKRWSRVRENFPEHPRGYTGAAEVYMELKDFTQAENLCLQGQQNASTAPGSFTLYAQCAMRQRQYSQALERWALVREKFPDLPIGYIGASNTYLFSQAPDKAEEICLQGLRLLQDHASKATLSYHHVEIFIKTGNPVRAIQALLALYEQEPSFHKEEIFWEKLSAALLKLMISLQTEGINIQSSSEVITSLAYLLREDSQYCLEKIYDFIFLAKRLAIDKKDIILTIQAAIKKFELSTSIATLFLSGETAEDQKESLFNLLISGNKNTIKILWIRPELELLIRESIDKILAKKIWKQFNEETLFSFVRILNFFDQEKADILINSAIQNSGNLPLKTPKGVLAFRKKAQKNIISKGIPYNKSPLLNVALCISGQLRGFEQAFPSIMKAFDFQNHNTQIFVHTWENIGRKFPQNLIHTARVFSGKFLSAYRMVFKNKEYLQDVYPHFYSLLTDTAIVTKEYLQSIYKTQHIVIENDNNFPFKTFSNVEKMLYKISSVYKMTESFNFDLIIWIRPDVKIQVPSQISLKALYDISALKKCVYINTGYTACPFSDCGYSIDEMLTIGTQETMKIHAETYSDMKNIFWKQQAFSCPPQFIGHLSREYQLFTHGVKVENLKNISYSYVDPKKISIESIYDALKKDTATRVLTEEDNLLLKACEEDMSSKQ